MIDEGILLWFPGTASYTGEDMAEFHVHGSKAIIK
jgi:Predicted GTPase